AEAAHGHEHTWLGRNLLDPGAQTLDVDVEGLRVAEVVFAPHPVDELSAGEHPAGVPHQHLEKVVLLERHRDLFTVHGDCVALQVHPNGTDLDDGVVFFVINAAPHHCADACQQFAGR